jgi:Fe-S cluster biogenesis protein NfuA
VTDDKDFQNRVQKIGQLVRDLETVADPAARAATKELVQLLMDMHGAGLERVMEIAFQSGEPGARLIDDLGQDPLVSSLLVLYGLHPDDLQTRVERKLKQIDSKLHKMGAEASLVSLQDGHVHLKAHVNGHSCGSTARSVQTILEEAIYEAAPDLSSLKVEGLEEPAASGFVALDKLTASPVAFHPTLTVSEGMD